MNVEAVLLGNVGVTWFESGMNLKKLILVDMAKRVGSDLISVVLYKLFGEDTDAFKCLTGVNLQITDVTAKSFRAIIEIIVREDAEKVFGEVYGGKSQCRAYAGRTSGF